jgi:hypothetical protein
LDVYVDNVVRILHRPGEPLDAMTVTYLAHHYLDSLCDPARRPGGDPPYRAYSHPMLVIAAMCRLAERLPLLATPLPTPAPNPIRRAPNTPTSPTGGDSRINGTGAPVHGL